mmetsp:Transcript_4402/g.7832  ORF Transcript_4402/g.7832 Transcript_4402/m.7832 type:complete len:294 (-) Transcript_4402:994-1875(-)
MVAFFEMPRACVEPRGFEEYTSHVSRGEDLAKGGCSPLQELVVVAAIRLSHDLRSSIVDLAHNVDVLNKSVDITWVFSQIQLVLTPVLMIVPVHGSDGLGQLLLRFIIIWKIESSSPTCKEVPCASHGTVRIFLIERSAGMPLQKFLGLHDLRLRDSVDRHGLLDRINSANVERPVACREDPGKLHFFTDARTTVQGTIPVKLEHVVLLITDSSSKVILVQRNNLANRPEASVGLRLRFRRCLWRYRWQVLAQLGMLGLQVFTPGGARSVFCWSNIPFGFAPRRYWLIARAGD